MKATIINEALGKSPVNEFYSPTKEHLALMIARDFLPLLASAAKGNLHLETTAMFLARDVAWMGLLGNQQKLDYLAILAHAVDRWREVKRVDPNSYKITKALLANEISL